jgi:acylphosphatase
VFRVEKPLPRRKTSQTPSWLYADLSPMTRSSRAARVREWRQVERGEPRSTPPIERWQMIARGRVQGVGYRAACWQKAKELNLCGWVRNLSDGSVEVQAEGPVHQLTELLLWCERGPSGAEVLSVSTGHLPPSREDWFEIRA